MTELSVQDRAVFALARFVFPRDAIVHAQRRAKDIAQGDTEVEVYLAAVLSLAEAGR